MMTNATAKKKGENFKYLALMEKAAQFSNEFWTELFARSCDIDVIRSVYASLGKLHQSGESEAALSLIYAMNLFNDCELNLPMQDIYEHPAFISVFMSEFFDVSAEEIEDVEAEAKSMSAEMDKGAE